MDSTLIPDVTYTYQIIVVNSSGFQAPSPGRSVGLKSLSPVQIETLVFSSTTASAALGWNEYAGDDFVSYRIMRSVGFETQQIKQIEDRAETSFVDSLLHGNQEYSYTIVVVTDHGEELASDIRSGSFHSFLESWPLELELNSYVRLAAEDNGVISALISDWRHVRLLKYGRDGELRDQQLLIRSNPDRNPYHNQHQQAITSVVGPGDIRYVAVTGSGGKARIRGFREDGTPITRHHPLFIDELAELTDVTVSGTIGLWNQNGRDAWFDDVEVSIDGRVVLADDFEAGQVNAHPVRGWDTPVNSYITSASRRNYDYLADNQWLHVGEADTDSTVTVGLRQVEVEESWRLEADLVAFFHAGIQIGQPTDNTWRFRLGFEFETSQAQLEWYQRVSGSDVGMSFSIPFPTAFSMWDAAPDPRLALEVRDGRVSASVTTPVLWSDPKIDDSEAAPWAAMVIVDDEIGLSLGRRRYTVREFPEISHETTAPNPICDGRTWSSAESGVPMLGICLPLQHRILSTEALLFGDHVEWPGGIEGVGDGYGAGDGQLDFPLSFDIGPDDRYYVLDAGNSRIQVFSSNGEYITQWGRQGDGDGEFDFGGLETGDAFEGHVGSIAVDDEGFIYVADVGNGRIQKFAPTATP